MNPRLESIILDLTSSARKYSYESLLEGLELAEGDTVNSIYELSSDDLETVSSALNEELNNTRIDKDIVRRAGLIVTKEVIDEAIIMKNV